MAKVAFKKSKVLIMLFPTFVLDLNKCMTVF